MRFILFGKINLWLSVDLHSALDSWIQNFKEQETTDQIYGWQIHSSEEPSPMPSTPCLLPQSSQRGRGYSWISCAVSPLFGPLVLCFISGPLRTRLSSYPQLCVHVSHFSQINSGWQNPFQPFSLAALGVTLLYFLLSSRLQASIVRWGSQPILLSRVLILQNKT